MARRRWKCFREFTSKGYQKKRSRSHRREFVRGGADPKITRFELGDKNIDDWDVKIGLVSNHNKNISHFTLEAIRISATRRLQKYIGKSGYRLRIRTHPHTVYREHAMMSFAGADRLSAGMRNGFGRPVGRAARVRAGDIIMECGCTLNNAEIVKHTLQVASNKICTTTRLLLLDAARPELIPKVALPYAKNYSLHSKV